MKRIIKIMLTVSMLLLCILFTVSCGNKLETPEGFNLNPQTIVLSWDKVKGAMSYAIQISGEEREKTTRSNSIELEYLEAGTYEIKVKAIGNDVDNKDSDWATYTYERAEESGLKFKLVNGNTEYQLVGGGNASGDVVLEAYYRGKPVTSIAEKALYNNSRITSIVIGSNIKSIGEKAFAKCSKLTSVTIEEGVTEIGDYLFQSCKSLVSVTLPDSITEIKPYTFSWCSAMENIKLGSKITGIGDYAFSNCKALQTITLPDTVKTIGEFAFSDCVAMKSADIGDGVESIAVFGFANCTALETITLSSSLKAITQSCFQKCASLTSVTIPDSVTSIDVQAFAGCTALADITLGTGITSIGYQAFIETAFYNNSDSLVVLDGWVLATKDLTISKIVVPEGVYGIADNAYQGCYSEKLERINLTGIKYIGTFAFNNCKYVWDVSFDDALLSIGPGAFAYCTYLENIEVGNSLTEIGTQAFYGCSMLASMEIPDTVTSIGGNAFTDTLAYKNTRNGVVYIDDWAVGCNIGAGYLLGMTIRDGIRGIASYAFYQAPILGEFKIADSVEYIGRSAFYQCATLNLIELPSNLKKIDDFAFYQCINAVFSADGTLTIPSGVESIGRSAFYNCGGIISLEIPASVKSIGDFAFYKCERLGATVEITEGEDPVEGYVKIENGVESIGNRAFQGCTALVDIKIPASVTSLGSHLFYKCTALKSIVIESSITDILEYTFYNCTALENVTLPESVKTIGKYAFRGCTAITDINVSNVETLYDYAFYKCSGITEFDFTDSLKHIGNYALRGCTGVTALYLPESVETIGKHAFYGMNDTTIYCEADSRPRDWEERFNTSYRPIFFGCTLSDGCDYVVSFTPGEANPDNIGATGGVSDPTREGYTFVGWSTVENGTVPTYTSETVADAVAGTTLYAIWAEEINEETQE